MEEFIKYIRSLEQHFADLDAATKQSAVLIDKLETHINNLEDRINSQNAHIKELEAELQALKAAKTLEPIEPIEPSEPSEPAEPVEAPAQPELDFGFVPEFIVEEPEAPEPQEVPETPEPQEVPEAPAEPVAPEEDLMTLDEEETLVEADNLEEVETLDGLEDTPAESVAPAAPVAPAKSAAMDVESFRRKYASQSATRNDSLFHTRVEDIGRAMSLGDQFFFRHELFSDNGELMAKTISILNGAADINEATRYIIKNFGQSWEQVDHATVSRFMDVVQRRFI